MAVVPAPTRRSSAPDRVNRLRTGWPAIALALAAWPATALEVGMVETGLKDGEYRVVFEAVLDAPPASIAAVLTDYARYPDLDPRISASDVLGRTRSGDVLLHTRVRVCSAFLCRDVDRVERVTRRRNVLVAEVVPDRSDFRRGLTTTRWLAARGRTRIHYAAEFEPDFWVPDILGRHFALDELREATLKLFANVESRARDL